MDCLAGAADDQEKGVEMGTHEKYASSWDNWVVWLNHVKAGSDPYLQGFSCTEKIRCLCGFLHALRRGDFSPTGDQIKGTTAKTAINHVAATLTASGGKDPRLDGSGKPSLLIERQISSYKKVDPKTKHQKAIPPEVYRFILRRAKLPRKRAVAELLCSALFFAKRSCEYSKTQRHHEKQTRTIRPCDVTFIKDNKILSHAHPNLHNADIVIVTFGPQKSDAHRDESIPQESTNDEELNPVWHLAYTIRRLRSYPGYDMTWPIYTYYDSRTKRFSDIRSYEVKDTIQSAVTAIGPDILGFSAEDVGTHSNRGAFTMMLYLSGAPIFTIMKLGRWLSDAFLDYIEQQVLSFSKGISTKMLHSNTFFNFPVKAQTSEIIDEKQTETETPDQSNHYKRSKQTKIFGRHNSLRDQIRPSTWPIQLK